MTVNPSRIAEAPMRIARSPKLLEGSVEEERRRGGFWGGGGELGALVKRKEGASEREKVGADLDEAADLVLVSD